jgi:hypothetical protein
MSFLDTFEVVVSGRLTIMAFSRFVRHGMGSMRAWHSGGPTPVQVEPPPYARA